MLVLLTGDVSVVGVSVHVEAELGEVGASESVGEELGDEGKEERAAERKTCQDMASRDRGARATHIKQIPKAQG